VAPTRKTARPREKVIRGMQEHFGLGRLAVSTRQRFEAAVRVSGIESLWRQVTQMSDAFRKLMLASFAISVSCLPVRADQMPFEGAWAPVSSNFPGSEVKACAAVAKFGLARLSGNADDVETVRIWWGMKKGIQKIANLGAFCFAPGDGGRVIRRGA